jgi:hypothetical protein
MLKSSLTGSVAGAGAGYRAQSSDSLCSCPLLPNPRISLTRRLSCAIMIAMPSLLASQPSKYAAFWQWFAAHDARLHAVRSSTDPLLDSLRAALGHVHADLTFELGPAAARRELVLSADGIRVAFPEVEALAAAAPVLSTWRVIKFRPRRTPLNSLRLDGTEFSPARTRFVLVKDEPGKVGIILFVEHYTKARHDYFANAGFLLLDEALGEYDMETKVGAVDFLDATSRYFTQSRPLTELPSAFDAFFAGRESRGTPPSC